MREAPSISRHLELVAFLGHVRLIIYPMQAKDTTRTSQAPVPVFNESTHVKPGFFYFIFYFAIDDLRDGICIHPLGEDLQAKFDDKQLDQGYRCQPQDRARDIHPKINCCEVADFTAV